MEKMSYAKMFAQVSANVEKEIIDCMKQHNLTTVNLITADVLQHWDKLYTYRYDDYDQLEERHIVALVANGNEQCEWLDIVSIDRFESDLLDDEQDNDVTASCNISSNVDALFGGMLLGIFTAYNLSESLSQLKELIAEQSGK